MVAQDSIDTLDREIESALDAQHSSEKPEGVLSSVQPGPTESDLDDHLPPVTPSAGDRVEVFWSADNQLYSGEVTMIHDGCHQMTYDEGDVELLNICEETWRFSCPSSNTGTISGSTAFELQSSSQSDLEKMFNHFGNKVFLLHHAQAFPAHVLQKAYLEDETSFKQTVRLVPRSSVDSRANVISSNVLYKTKVDEDSKFKLKARIAPHANENSLKYELRSDCSMCAPMGVRILISVAVLKNGVYL